MTPEEERELDALLESVDLSDVEAEPDPMLRDVLYLRNGTFATRDASWDPWVFREPPLEPTALVRFEHGGFLGNCPSYDVTVYEDGRVEYVGLANVRVKGLRTRWLDPESMTELRQLLDDLPADESYDWAPYTHAGWDAAPCAFSRHIVYRDASAVRVVRHIVDGDHSAPPCLRHRELDLVRLTRVVRWTGTDPLGDGRPPWSDLGEHKVPTHADISVSLRGLEFRWPAPRPYPPLVGTP